MLLSQRQASTPEQASAPAAPEPTTGGYGNAATAEDTGLTDTGDPADRAANGSHEASQHLPTSVGEGFNADPTTAPSPTRTDGLDAYVSILHGFGSELVSESASDADLYTEEPAVPDMSLPGEHITAKDATATSPYALELPVDEPLYVDGRPTVDDVHQVGIGDCYSLASLAELTARDPGHISGMISGGAGTMTVSFFRHDGTAWVAAPVTVDKSLAYNVDAAGATGSLVGAGFRVDNTPERTEWAADVDSEALSVQKTDYHEMALWAPLFEKAYAQFSQQYGKYGGAPGTGDAPATGGESGYDMIEGGENLHTYGIFYGPDLVSTERTDTTFSVGDDIVTLNRDTIARLLTLSGEGLAPDQTAMLEAATFQWEAFPRIKQQADQLKRALVEENANRGLMDWTTSLVTDLYDGRSAIPSKLDELMAAIDTWDTAPDDTAKATARDDIKQRCVDLSTPGNYPVLHEDGAPDAAAHFLELATIAMNTGADNGTGQRNVYSEHSYSVLAASFRGADGSDLALTAGNLDTELPNVSGPLSSVHLRNPHGTNEPDLHGEGTAGQDEGEFDMPLDVFLRAFTMVRGCIAESP